MLKIIFGMLLKVRQVMQILFQKVFERIRDPKTGKLTIISPKNITVVLWTIGAIFFAIIIASKLITTKKNIIGGADAFRKELTPKIGINDTPPSAVYDEDPLGDLLKKNDNGAKNQKEMNTNYLGVSSDGKSGDPTKDDCNALMNRMQNGDDLAGKDKDQMNVCLDKNIAGWTPDQVQMAKTLLNDQTLTPEERDLLRRGLEGKLSPEELALARALSGNDPKAREMARLAIKENDEATKKALAAALMGKQLDAQQKSLFDKLSAAAEKALGAAGVGLNGAGAANGTSGKDGSGSGVNGTNGLTPEQLAALAAEVAAKEAALRALEQARAEAQALAAQAGRAVAAGKILSPSERAALAKLAELERQLAEAQKAQNEKRTILLREASKIQNTLARVATTIDQTLPSGFTVAYEDAPLLDCKKIKPLGKFVTRVKKKHYNPNDPNNPSNALFDLNGKLLSPDKVKLISLRRKKLMQLELANHKLQNPTGDFTKGGAPLDAQALLAQNGGQAMDLNQLMVFSDKSLKPFTLTPDMKVPAVLLNMILVSSKGKPQIIRAQVLQDVYNPENNNLVIPKGSVIVGTTQSFDEDTGIMDLSFNKISIGSGKVIASSFTVGSADGSMGLRGEVHDTRGKYLLGAFITSFSAGALNWFSQSALAPYTAATDITNSMIGAAGAGGADVANKISQMYAGDLQNAPSIYYVPKGVPIILFPTD